MTKPKAYDATQHAAQMERDVLAVHRVRSGEPITGDDLKRAAEAETRSYYMPKKITLDLTPRMEELCKIIAPGDTDRSTLIKRVLDDAAKGATLSAEERELAELLTDSATMAVRAERMKHGLASFPVRPETTKMLNAVRRPGENDEDLVNRLTHTNLMPKYPSGTPEYQAADLIAHDMMQHFGKHGYAGDKIDNIIDHMTPVAPRDALLDHIQHVQDETPFSLYDTTAHTRMEKLSGTIDQQARTERGLALHALQDGIHGKRLAQLRKNVDDALQNKAVAQQALLTAENRHQAIKDIIEIAKAPKLQRLGETAWHKVCEAWRSGSIISPQHKDGRIPEAIRMAMAIHSNIFVVQHDWAAAFVNATGIEDGNAYPLPYPEVTFEFRISGRRVCCSLITEEDEETPLSALLHIETSVGWAFAAMYGITKGVWSPVTDKEDIQGPILNLCREQIRAVCIALAAEVAETEVVRAPHKLNRSREKNGKLPIFDYHVVNLAHRKHIVPRVPEPGDIEEHRRSPRMHFVRAHDRFYPNHKVRIPWHLRGNPDLGFVDKEYRL